MLSVVTTLYNSSPYLPEFYNRITIEVQKIHKQNYEIVLVNDGSPDDSLEIALRIAEKDPRVVVVDLSRNFGHHNAIIAGLKQAQGDSVFLIDVDLEEQPEWLNEFETEMKTIRCDVVFGVQEKRKGGLFEQVSGSLFYRTFRILSGIELPDNIMTARLMSRAYVNALLTHQEKDVFLGGLMHITGFHQRSIVLNKINKGSSSYTIRKKISLLVSAVTSFSSKPLVYIFYLGSIVFFASMFLAAAFTIRWIAGDIGITGWTSVIISIWMLGGLILMSIGILGIYISKIFIEVKARPNAIINSVYNIGDLS